jgi:hypothetical protein
MPPQHIFVSKYTNYRGANNSIPNEISDSKKLLSGVAIFSGISCLNEMIKKFNNNFNFNINTPDNFNSYTSYKINNFPCEEWRNELNKCYSVTKQCNHLDIIELQNKLEKCS